MRKEVIAPEDELYERWRDEEEEKKMKLNQKQLKILEAHKINSSSVKKILDDGSLLLKSGNILVDEDLVLDKKVKTDEELKEYLNEPPAIKSNMKNSEEA